MIEFDEDNNSRYFVQQQRMNKPQTSGLTKLVIKIGLARDEKSAKIVFVWISIACFALAILMNIYFFARPAFLDPSTGSVPQIMNTHIN